MNEQRLAALENRLDSFIGEFSSLKNLLERALPLPAAGAVAQASSSNATSSLPSASTTTVPSVHPEAPSHDMNSNAHVVEVAAAGMNSQEDSSTKKRRIEDDNGMEEEPMKPKRRRRTRKTTQISPPAVCNHRYALANINIELHRAHPFTTGRHGSVPDFILSCITCTFQKAGQLVSACIACAIVLNIL